MKNKNLIATGLIVCLGMSSFAHAQAPDNSTQCNLYRLEQKKLNEDEHESKAFANGIKLLEQSIENKNAGIAISATGVILAAGVFALFSGSFKIDLAIHGNSMGEFLSYLAANQGEANAALDMAKGDFAILLGSGIFELISATGVVLNATQYAELSKQLEKSKAIQAEKDADIAKRKEIQQKRALYYHCAVE